PGTSSRCSTTSTRPRESRVEPRGRTRGEQRASRRTMTLVMRETATIVIGAGQAALSLSRRLSAARHDHVLLERGRVGDAWLQRWDSLHLLTPNWLNRLDGAPSHEVEHGFLKASDFAGYLRRYARSFGAPVHERTTVERVGRYGDGYVVETDHGAWRAG